MTIPSLEGKRRGFLGPVLWGGMRSYERNVMQSYRGTCYEGRIRVWKGFGAEMGPVLLTIIEMDPVFLTIIEMDPVLPFIHP